MKTRPAVTAPQSLPAWVDAMLARFPLPMPLEPLAPGLSVTEHHPAPESAPSAPQSSEARGEAATPSAPESEAPSAPKAPRKPRAPRKPKAAKAPESAPSAPVASPEGESEAPRALAPSDIPAPEGTDYQAPEGDDTSAPECERPDALAFYSLAPDSLSD